MRWPLPPKSNSESGFTLIELIVVVVIIGILAAIAGPSWLGFVQQRKVNAVNDAIIQAIERAKNNAQKEKMSYSVGVRSLDGIPQIAVYPASLNVPENGSTFNADEQAAMDAYWRTDPIDGNLNPNEVVIATNLQQENDVDSTGAYTFNNGQQVSTIPDMNPVNQPPTHRLTFDLTGTLSNTPGSATESNEVEAEAVLLASVAENWNQLADVQANTKILTGPVRCTRVGTLIGGFQVGRGAADCTTFLAEDDD